MQEKQDSGGDNSHGSGTGGRRQVPTQRECTYTDFLKCQPMNFKGTEGVIGLTQWVEKMESVFLISNCAITKLVKGEIKKLESEYWNLKVRGTDLTTYNSQIQELALMCDRIVKASKPQSMQEAIEFATEMMDKKMLTAAERSARSPGVTAQSRRMEQGNRAGNGNAEQELMFGSTGTNPTLMWSPVTMKKAEDKSKEKQLEEVPIVQDFPSISRGLAGIPPTRQWNSNRSYTWAASGGKESLSAPRMMICSINYKVRYLLKDRPEIILEKQARCIRAPKLILELLKRNIVMHVDPAKIESFKIGTPNLNEIRQFLGLAGYYRRFIEGFSKIAKPMTKLTQKKIKFDWSDKAEAAFQLIKQKLCSAPILALPEGNEDFIAYCDASIKG
ncbi:putative reverse transcriptase domain-containing protein [Tanacetum coccineum]